MCPQLIPQCPVVGKQKWLAWSTVLQIPLHIMLLPRFVSQKCQHSAVPYTVRGYPLYFLLHHVCTGNEIKRHAYTYRLVLVCASIAYAHIPNLVACHNSGSRYMFIPDSHSHTSLSSDASKQALTHAFLSLWLILTVQSLHSTMEGSGRLYFTLFAITDDS